MAKPPKWMIYAGGATVVLLAYTFLTSPDAAAPRSSANAYRASASPRKAGTELYRAEDYTIRFPAVNVVPRDAFKPLVAKTTKTLSNAEAQPDLPNGIPAVFTGGDGNWIYTGNAVVNGVPNALLENTSSQETVFLRPGERWKRLTVARITENQIELIGPTGQRRSVAIADSDSLSGGSSDAPAAAPATTGAARAPAGVGTLPPVGTGGLAGAIGAAPNTGRAPTGDNRTNRRNRGNRRNNRNDQNNANPPVTTGTPLETP